MNAPIPPIKNNKPLTLAQALDIIEELRQQLVELTAENQKLKDQIAKNSLVGCILCTGMYHEPWIYTLGLWQAAKI